MYILFKTVILIVTFTIPYWVPKTFGRQLKPAPWWLLGVAGLLWIASGQLPNIHISSETNTFQEHFVGGGMYCALLYTYFVQALDLRLKWWQELLLLFAVASSLGVANELFEFAATKSNIIAIDISDTSWDLVANTTGAFTGFLLLLPLRAKRKQ